MVNEDLIQKLEALYQNLLTKDATPDEEAEAKAKILEILSSIKAYAEMQGGTTARNLVDQTNALKDMLLAWDPYGSAWFKEEKTLVDSVYNILASAKALTIQKISGGDESTISALKQQIDEINSSFNTQIANLQNEIASIKKSIIALATAVKDRWANQPTPQEPARTSIPLVEQKPVSLSMPTLVATPIVPKPVSVPKEKPKKVTPKTVSIPRPIPIPLDDTNLEPSPEASSSQSKTTTQKPIPIPKPDQLQVAKPAAKRGSKPSPKPRESRNTRPRLIPLEESLGPTPIPLTDEEFEKPIPLDAPEVEPLPLDKSEVDRPSLLGTLTSSRESKKKPDKDQLFNLFSSNPAIIPENEGVEPVQDTSRRHRGAKPLPITPQEALSPAGSQDSETLYQELISLEGKRYSIERSIRDLKTDRENGVLNDQEFKGKISQLLDKLQTISKRIDEIRKKLD